MDRIKNYSTKMIKHPFFSGSLIMIIGSNIANVFAYLYHIIFGRYLEIAAYGNLSAFLALLGLVGTVLSFVSLVIIKFTASTKESELPALMRWFFEKTMTFAVIISVIILLIAAPLSTSLKMPVSLVYLVAPTFLAMTFLFLQRSFIQGLLNFKLMAIVNNVNLILRILFGILFVYLGFAAFGASLGVLFGFLISMILNWQYLKKYKIFKSRDKFEFGTEVLKYSFPIFITTVGTTALLNMDLLLVKYYFSPEVAGQYAAISVLGKIIFYATSPIASVMFPMISNRFAQNKNYIIIFIFSFLLTLMAGISVTIGYFVIPQLAILPIYGQKYMQIAQYIGIYGIFITLFTLSNLIVNFYQSIDKPTIGFIFPAAVVAQITSIYLYHDTLNMVIQNLILVMGATLLSLIIFFAQDMRKSYYGKK